MHADGLATHLVAYLSLREALGFQMRPRKSSCPSSSRMCKRKSAPAPSVPR